MKTKLCECGCGTPARPGKRYAKYHRLLNGRVVIWTGDAYVYRYRLVVEKHIGRKLLPEEVVHHLNNNPLDDRIENLHLCKNNTEHKSMFHNGNGMGEYTCLICSKKHRGETRKKYHFCSRECWKQWKSPGRPITTGTGTKISFTCQQCSNHVVRKGKQGERLYCSHECYSKSLVGKRQAIRSNARLIEYNGEAKTILDWAITLGIPFKTLHSRLVQYQWETKKALTTPVRNRRR